LLIKLQHCTKFTEILTVNLKNDNPGAQLINAHKIWQNEKSVFLSVTASKLITHLKHHCKKHDTEHRVAHLQSELYSIHVSTVHTAPTGNSEYFVVKLHNVIIFFRNPKQNLSYVVTQILTNLQKVSVTLLVH
jgi:hypothetical protein